MTALERRSPQPPTQRGIAVLGGSFDPPHRSHVRLAATARERLPVDEVRVIPAGDHPHKAAAGMTPAIHRLAMCRVAFRGEPRVVVDDRELRRAGRSFTVDTLAELRDETGRELWFLIGSDNLPLLPTWHEHHRLLALATVVTWPRQGHPVRAEDLARLDLTTPERERLLANVLDLPADAIASSDLRARWRRGERDLPEIPSAVRDYIAAHSVY